MKTERQMDVERALKGYVTAKLDGDAETGIQVVDDLQKYGPAVFPEIAGCATAYLLNVIRLLAQVWAVEPSVAWEIVLKAEMQTREEQE